MLSNAAFDIYRLLLFCVHTKHMIGPILLFAIETALFIVHSRQTDYEALFVENNIIYKSISFSFCCGRYRAV